MLFGSTNLIQGVCCAREHGDAIGTSRRHPEDFVQAKERHLESPIRLRLPAHDSVYLWAHEPCLFGWIRGEKPKILRAQVGTIAGDFPTTVWAVGSSEIETDAHPTSKPTKLFAVPIEMHTEPGELCYEPFCGSGSQMVAAQQLGRRCYAIEKSPPFVTVTLERMATLGPKPQLAEARRSVP